MLPVLILKAIIKVVLEYNLGVQLIVGMHEALGSSSTNNNKNRRKATLSFLFDTVPMYRPFFLQEILTEWPALCGQPFLDIVMCC